MIRTKSGHSNLQEMMSITLLGVIFFSVRIVLTPCAVETGGDFVYNSYLKSKQLQELEAINLTKT